MDGSGGSETTHYVVLRMTSAEAKQLVRDVLDAAETYHQWSTADGREEVVRAGVRLRNRLEGVVSAIGVGLAQVPPS